MIVVFLVMSGLVILVSCVVMWCCRWEASLGVGRRVLPLISLV